MLTGDTPPLAEERERENKKGQWQSYYKFRVGGAFERFTMEMTHFWDVSSAIGETWDVKDLRQWNVAVRLALINSISVFITAIIYGQNIASWRRHTFHFVTIPYTRIECLLKMSRRTGITFIFSFSLSPKNMVTATKQRTIPRKYEMLQTNLLRASIQIFVFSTYFINKNVKHSKS